MPIPMVIFERTQNVTVKLKQQQFFHLLDNESCQKSTKNQHTSRRAILILKNNLNSTAVSFLFLGNKFLTVKIVTLYGVRYQINLLNFSKRTLNGQWDEKIEKVFPTKTLEPRLVNANYFTKLILDYQCKKCVFFFRRSLLV